MVETRTAVEPGKLRELPTLKLEGLGTGNSIDNIQHQMRTVQITQSIYSPYVSTRIGIVDAVAMHEKLLPVLGEEKFTMSGTDSGGRTIAAESYVHTMGDMAVHENRRGLTYVLIGESEWMQNNFRDKVRKTFHDMSYPDMASAIASEYLQKSLDDVDSSPKIQKDYFCLNLSPIQQINVFAKRCWDVSGSSDSFYQLFARMSQGKEELVLKNIRKLLEEGPVWTFYLTQHMDNEKEIERMQVQGQPVSRITGISKSNNNNSQNLTFAGYDSRGFQQVDVYKRNVIEVENTSSRPSYLGGSELQTSSYRGSHMSAQVTPHVRTRYETVDTTPQYFHETLYKNMYSQPLINSLTQKDITIETHGNALIKAGDVVKIEEPRIDGFDEREKSERYSGNYVVTNKVDTIGNDGTFTSKLTLSRESDTL